MKQIFIATALTMALLTGCFFKTDSLSKDQFSKTAKLLITDGSSSKQLEVVIPDQGSYRTDFSKVDRFKGLTLSFEEGSCNSCRVILTRVDTISLSDNGIKNVFRFQVIGELKKAIGIEINREFVLEAIGTSATLYSPKVSGFFRKEIDSTEAFSEVQLGESDGMLNLSLENLSSGYISLRKTTLITNAAVAVIDYDPILTVTQFESFTASPTKWQGVSSATIAPTLPSGLSFNTTTGVISGTSTILSTSTNYTITAKNTSGETTTKNLSLLVQIWRPLTSPNITLKASTYGWSDGLGATVFPLTQVTVPSDATFSGSVVYKCSTRAMYGSSVETWVNCDGAEGTTLFVRPAQDATHPDGQYNLKIKAQTSTGLSGPESLVYTWYAHTHLDGERYCTSYDAVTDDVLFNTASGFALMASAHTFGSATDLSAPRNVIQWANGNIGEIRSLSKKMSRRTVNGVDLIIARKIWGAFDSDAATQAQHCLGRSALGHGLASDSGIFPAPSDFVNNNTKIHCLATAMNADGRALCLIPTASYTALETPHRLHWTRRLGNAYNYGGIFPTRLIHYTRSTIAKSYYKESEGAYCDNFPATDGCRDYLNSQSILLPD